MAISAEQLFLAFKNTSPYPFSEDSWEAADPGVRKRWQGLADQLNSVGEALSGLSDFGFAVSQMKQGQRVARRGWNNNRLYLELQVPDANSKMGLPYIYMRITTGKLVPFTPSQTDILSEDWFLVQKESTVI